MKPYIPVELPINNLDYRSLISLVGEANAELARYDGLLQGIVNPSILLSPLTTQEAVLSSRIEGTQASLDEVLEMEAGIQMSDEKSKDIAEIINYRKALVYGSEKVKESQLSMYVIRELHKILLDGVRGANKSPGDFRKEQNWIGTPGTPMELASFIPPSPMILIEHLEKFEKYIESNDIDPLIQTSLIHAQFELIHPFLDGNGRIGRLLIPLFLYKKGMLSSPMFYLSSYLEANREIYYAGLNAISREGNWDNWVRFFLRAIAEQSKKNSQLIHQIMDLYKQKKEIISNLLHSQYSIKVVDALFHMPVFNSTQFIHWANIPKNTAMPLLRTLKKNEVVTVFRESSGSQPAVYIFPKLINITEGKKLY